MTTQSEMLDTEEVWDRARESERVVLDEADLGGSPAPGNGLPRSCKRLVMRHNWYPAFVIEVDCDQCGGQLRTDEVARPESMKDAVAIYNAVGRPEFEKLAAPYRRLGNMDADVQGLERRVITVGSTVEAAVNQLAYMLELDEADAIEYLEDENLEPGGWFCVFRMKRSGTSMKASGVYVPGGVVLHWWK